MNAERRPESIARTRTRIFELAISNPWDYFITLTIDAKKLDRFDLEQYSKKLSDWIKNRNQRMGLRVQYLLIPVTVK